LFSFRINDMTALSVMTWECLVWGGGLTRGLTVSALRREDR